MKYRRLGNAGLKVSEIALGAWLTYGHSVEDKTAHRILHRALDAGVNFIDVADVYAAGEAERVVGDVLKERERHKVIISTKAFWPMSRDVNDRGLSRQHIMASVHQSLRRFQTDYIDLFFCHLFDPETPMEETIRCLNTLVEQGKILYWGTSVWNAQQLQDAVDLAEQYNLYKPQMEQPRYNLLDRHIETEGVVEKAGQHGIGLTVWSPLAQGILTGKYNDGIPTQSRMGEDIWPNEQMTEANIGRVRALTELAHDIGVSMAQLALIWILRLSEISSVIIGARTEKQLDENLDALNYTDRLTPDVLARIETILSA